MARCIVLLLIIAYGSGMKMRETVERTVMVRTTGSDLQPAATGYVYKRGTDGEAVVTKLGESEVMEQLSKLYEPQEFVGSIPNTGPFAKEQKNAAIKSDDKVIPVVEKNDEVDGIADEDYRKVIDEYASNFDDYLKGLERFKEFSKKEFGFDVHHEYDPKVYDKHDNGEYDTKKYESYYMAREDKPYDNVYGKKYKHVEYNNGDYTGYKGPQNDAFRYKQDEKNGKDANSFHGDEHKYYGGGTGNDRHEQSSEHYGQAKDKDLDEHETTTSDEDTSTNAYADFGSKSGLVDGEGFGYKVKH